METRALPPQPRIYHSVVDINLVPGRLHLGALVIGPAARFVGVFTKDTLALDLHKVDRKAKAGAGGQARRYSTHRRKDFDDFPKGAQLEMARALTILAEGQMPDMAKPLTGFGSGVMELALKHRGDAFRVVYALQIDNDIWVIHAFQKKSKSGVKTPKAEIDLIHERLKRLKERFE